MVYRKNEYEYGGGWHPNVDANTVGEALERIEAEHGVVTSELFLEESRPENAPTHDVFEWDDSAAAEKYRLHQSSMTINNLRVVIRNDSVQEGQRKAFVNISVEQKANYLNVVDALSKPETREIVLERAVRELEQFKNKYDSLSELAAIFTAIEAVKSRRQK